MFWFKSCSKCGTGDLYEGHDHYGPYIACLHCGHYLTEAEEVVLRYAAGAGSPTHRQADVQSAGLVSTGKSLVGAGSWRE